MHIICRKNHILLFNHLIIGNVAVASEYRRQSIATKLIKLSYKILGKYRTLTLHCHISFSCTTHTSIDTCCREVGGQVFVCGSRFKQ